MWSVKRSLTSAAVRIINLLDSFSYPLCTGERQRGERCQGRVMILKSDIGRRGPEGISPRFQERLLPAQSVQSGKGREHVSMRGKTVEQRHLFPTMSLFLDVRTLDVCSCLRMLLVLELETLPCRRSSRIASCDMRSAVDSRDPSRGDRYCSSVCTTPARDEKARGKRE